MDKELIERVALEVLQDSHCDMTKTDAVNFAKYFLARIDAERGKDAVAWLHDAEGRFDAIHTKVKDTLDASFAIYGFAGRIDRPAVNTAEHYTIPLFLSPTIPEGYAELQAKLAAAEKVIAAIDLFINSPISENICAITNVAIAEYKKGGAA